MKETHEYDQDGNLKSIIISEMEEEIGERFLNILRQLPEAAVALRLVALDANGQTIGSREFTKAQIKNKLGKIRKKLHFVMQDGTPTLDHEEDIDII